MTADLVTFDALANLLGLEGSDIDDYPALGVIRESVVSAIESYLGRELEVAERTHTDYAGDGLKRLIRLPAVPVITVASVMVDGNTMTWAIRNYGISLGMAVRNARIDVAYTGGLENIPAAMRRAALLQTAYEFQSKDQIGAETVSSDGGSVTRPALQLLPEIRRLLDDFKHPLMWR